MQRFPCDTVILWLVKPLQQPRTVNLPPTIGQPRKKKKKASSSQLLILLCGHKNKEVAFHFALGHSILAEHLNQIAIAVKLVPTANHSPHFGDFGPFFHKDSRLRCQKCELYVYMFMPVNKSPHFSSMKDTWFLLSWTSYAQKLCD